ncbi:TRAP transporter substrate-binding protein [Parahaliea mediterranea]|uniref:TRAP transporter substrate-binding protein n=1 Tax=Parahaliea mediterranea TaxID=651086 RepID=UPI0013003ED5|nr:TRAP transporter substrate-binding protein [Parahaliea mediterranea]
MTRCLRHARHYIASLLLLWGFSMPAAATLFRIGLITPPGHQWTDAADAFASAVATQYGGEHEVIVYPSRQLGTEAQMLQLLQTGALDFAILTVSELSNRLPRFNALYAPYRVGSAQQAAELLGSAAARELLAGLPDELGVIGTGYTMAGMRHILSRKPLAQVQDLQGIKVRITPLAPVRDFYRLLGAAPTPMPLSSVFDALANGQIDAIDMDLESIWTLRYYEYADTLLLSGHMMFPAVGLMSARGSLRLPAHLRQALAALLQQQLEAVLNRYPALEAQWLNQLQATGITITAVDAAWFGEAPVQWQQHTLPP